MRKISVAVLLLASSLVLVGCGKEKTEESKEVQTYSQCLETEAAKLLDETGSNLDYANEMAAKACADLQ
jgi:Tfp pilus assembly protein PilP